MERENLAGDGKGKGTSGSNREAESTDAPERGGLPRSSDEAGVMLVEGKSQAPRSWDSRVAGNQDSGAYRRGLSSGRLRVIGP
jgi:hypothetical protein